MAWHEGTYACGHEGGVQIYGPVKDREWKEKQEFSKLCPECWKKKMDEENQKAIEMAKEMKLPELQGTEKQVAWANTLRLNLIDKFNNFIEEEFDDVNDLFPEFDGLSYKDVLKIRDYLIQYKTKASFYIDNRNESIRYFVLVYKKQALGAMKKEEEKVMIDELKQESTVIPENKITDIPAEITVLDEKITVITEKNDRFIELVKSLNYKWSGKHWYRRITNTNGPASERAAELGNKLLNAGFPIVIFDEEIRKKAINGDFEPEQKRWIFHRLNTDCLAIQWAERDDNLYKKARSLPGSKWSKGSVLVRVHHYQEVEEFAELYGFRFTEAAKELIRAHKNSLEKAAVVTPTKVKEPKQKDGLQAILESGDEVLDDLKD